LKLSRVLLLQATLNSVLVVILVVSFWSNFQQVSRNLGAQQMRWSIT
jgi:hypothetical protein